MGAIIYHEREQMLPPPAPPDLHADVWSEALQQFIDRIDSLATLPERLQYLGED
jgi:hypothetical protein